MRNDEHGGASSVVAFMVAGVIFVGSVGALLMTSRDSAGSGNNEVADAAALRLQSDSLADLLVGSPGYHLGGSGEYLDDWSALNADQLGRLGLRDADDPLMDFDKFQNLRRAGLASRTDDGLVNYPDALDSLGLDDTDLDFHVRAFPALRSAREILESGNRDPNLRVTYIADYLKLTGASSSLPTIGSPTCTPSGSKYTISTSVTNNGDTVTSFIADYRVTLGTAASYSDRSRTYELTPPGGTAVLSIDVPAKDGRNCSGSLRLELRDVKSRIARLDYTLSSTSTATTTVTKDLWSNPGKTYYNQGQPVVIEFDGDLPTCVAPTRPRDPPCPTPTETLRLVVTRADTGAVVYPVGSDPTTTTVTKTVRSITVPAARFDAAATHNYVATLSWASAGVEVSDRVLVLPAGASIAEFDPADATVTYSTTDSVAPEAGFLEDLVEKFCPYVFDSTSVSPLSGFTATTYASRCAFKSTTPLHATQPGDVIPDLQDSLNDQLPARLLDPTRTTYDQKCNGNIVGGPRYDIARVLVVGSNVDHNSMTSASAKYAVCEWVLGGGTLIVFGSAEQRVQWLEPIFKAAITSSSAPVSTPDASHPILNRADVLSYDGYRSNGTQVWSFNGQTALEQEDLLNNVVASGSSDSILAISNPGAFGDGTVILTTWLPYDLFDSTPDADGSEAEGLRLVNNFLMQGYRDLFLDYGPQIPAEGRQAAAAQRVVDIWHPEFTSDLVGGTCSEPYLVKRDTLGAPVACYEPITLTIFVYVF
jgi:hypothetical protein